uniref:Putative secreted protein n=1 Tax=Amblyomma cajennense TaxID=34607 RepID=A0A023FBR7_AMBCJ
MYRKLLQSIKFILLNLLANKVMYALFVLSDKQKTVLITTCILWYQKARRINSQNLLTEASFKDTKLKKLQSFGQNRMCYELSRKFQE